MEKLNSIYSRTYNFVYLRAKSILQKEDEIQQLMKEVYVKAIEEDVREDRLFQWFGKQIYTLGCGKYRKKKVREADYIELEEQEYTASKSVDLEKTKEIICDTLEELPDMYQATLYALYYDHMAVKEIAAVMGYSKETIINRLNYVHKYLSKVLEDYQEENKVKVEFSVEAVSGALCDWSANHCLSGTAAQNIYASICRELGIQTDMIEVAEGNAGMDKSVAMNVINEELSAYQMKQKKEINQKIVIVGVVGALVVLAIVVLLAFGKSDKKEEPKDQQPTKEQQSDADDADSDVNADTDADTSDDADTDSDTSDDADTNVDASEYILPNSNTARLTRADLQGLSKEQLRLARNEIFARYGTIFGVAELSEYFESKSWYSPEISFDYFNENIEMNLIEEANLSLILEVEEEME